MVWLWDWQGLWHGHWNPHWLGGLRHRGREHWDRDRWLRHGLWPLLLLWLLRVRIDCQVWRQRLLLLLLLLLLLWWPAARHQRWHWHCTGSIGAGRGAVQPCARCHVPVVGLVAVLLGVLVHQSLEQVYCGAQLLPLQLHVDLQVPHRGRWNVDVTHSVAPIRIPWPSLGSHTPSQLQLPKLMIKHCLCALLLGLDTLRRTGFESKRKWYGMTE